MISPRENHEEYQAALAWVGRQVEEAERQGLTLDYLGLTQQLHHQGQSKW
jgi:hypothetical protein